MFDRLNNTLDAIVSAKTNNILELAEIAAPGDKSFFVGANFDGIDLRGLDLSEFDLTGASLDGAITDETTVLGKT